MQPSENGTEKRYHPLFITDSFGFAHESFSGFVTGPPAPPYLPDFPSIRLSSSLWLGPPNSTSLPWCTTRSTIAAASLSSAKTVPYLPDSTLAADMALLLS